MHLSSIACLVALLGSLLTTGAARAHPLDPLNPDEIIGAAQSLLAGGAAQPGAIFQSVELREPAKTAVLNWRSGDAPLSRQATVFFRQNRQSFKSTVNLADGTFTRPVLIPISDGQLGLTITEVSDFSFAFTDPAFLAALARRGIRTPAQLAKVFVTPLTAGAFGLPEESKRIVKADVYKRQHQGAHGRFVELVRGRGHWNDAGIDDTQDATRVEIHDRLHALDGPRVQVDGRAIRVVHLCLSLIHI